MKNFLLNLPDPTKFLLLHSLGVCTTRHSNWLIQEIVQCHGNSSICFTRGNNRTGTLIVLPSYRTLNCYCFDLSKPKAALDEMLKCIVNNTNSTKEEAVSCLLSCLPVLKKVLLKGAPRKKWILWALKPCFKRPTSTMEMLGFFSAIWGNSLVGGHILHQSRNTIIFLVVWLPSISRQKGFGG